MEIFNIFSFYSIDDIIFNATNCESLCKDIYKLMQTMLVIGLEEKSINSYIHILSHEPARKTLLRTLSTTKAKYVYAVNYYSQLLWIKYQLKNYSNFEHNIPIFHVNTN